MDTVLITGCSSGFGLLTKLHFARRGVRVVATQRNLAKAGALEDARQREGLDLHVVALDVIDDASVAAAIARTEALGPIGALINNAGIEVRGPVEACDDALARRRALIHDAVYDPQPKLRYLAGADAHMAATAYRQLDFEQYEPAMRAAMNWND